MAGIVVIIGGDTSGLDEAVNRSQNRMRDLSKEMGKNVANAAKWGAGLAAAGAVAAGAIVASSIRAAKELDNMSKAANASRVTFQEWSFGAKTVGVESDKLADILKDVNDRVGDFLTTGGGPMADFFETIAPKVGVTAEQFRKLSGPDALQLYVTSLEKANLSQGEMTFFMEAMASDATALIPLLKNGGKAMKDQADEAQRLGLVLSDVEVTQLLKAGVELNKVATMTTVLSNRLSISLSKSIVDVSNVMVQEFSRGSDSLGDGVNDAVDVAMRGLADFMEGAANVISIISDNPISAQFGVLGWVLMGPKGLLIGAAIGATFDIIEEGLAKFGVGITESEHNARRLLETQQDIAKQQEIINQAGRDLESSFTLPSVPQAMARAAEEEIVKLEALEVQLKKTVSGSTEAQEKYNELLNAGTTNANSFSGSMLRVAEALRKSREASSGGEVEEIEEKDGTKKKLGGVILFTDEEKLAIAEKLEAIRQANLTEEALLREKQAAEIKLIEESNEAKLGLDIDYKQLQKDAEARHHEELVELNKAAEDQKTKDKQDALDEQTRLMEQAMSMENSLRQSVANNAVGLLSYMGRENKAFAVASIALSKGLAIAQTIQHTATAQMAAMAVDPTGLMAARVALMGKINIGIIAATGLLQASGAMSGGSSSGATGGGTGGGGGTSSASGNAAEPAPTETLVANINVTGQTFDRKTVIGLMEQIDELQSDGMRVRLVTA